MHSCARVDSGNVAVARDLAESRSLIEGRPSAIAKSAQAPKIDRSRCARHIRRSDRRKGVSWRRTLKVIRMARRPVSKPELSPADLSPDQMRTGVDRLKRRIAELDAFDASSIVRSGDPNITALEKSIEQTLQRAFGAGTIEQARYAGAASLHKDWGVVALYASKGMGGAPPSELQKEFSELKAKSLALLGQAVKGLEEEIAESERGHVKGVLPAPQKALQRKVFIVHGHEGEPREAVSGFLRKIDFTPVILHEQSNQGRTVVEKFEDHSDVDFAVVLLTPDDVGGPKGGTQQPRARQNVVLELGYFIGKLGRKNVCAIKLGDVEIPSDIVGVVWTPFDVHGAWKTALAKELRDAGHEIDWNKVMGP